MLAKNRGRTNNLFLSLWLPVQAFLLLIASSGVHLRILRTSAFLFDRLCLSRDFFVAHDAFWSGDIVIQARWLSYSLANSQHYFAVK